MIGLCNAMLDFLGNDSPGFRIGYIIGSALPLILVLAGIIKCVSIANRPTTSRSAATSLALLLGAVLISMVGGIGGRVLQEVAPGDDGKIAIAFVAVATLLLVIGLIVAALVLAVVGVVAIRAEPGRYTQGTRQAWMTLVGSTVLVLLIFGGAVAGYLRSEQRAPPLALRSSSSPTLPQPVAAADDSIKFPEFGFTFDTPPQPWVRVDAKRINAEACLAFAQARPAVYFMIIAEKLDGDADEYDREALADVVVTNQTSLVGEVKELSRAKREANGMAGMRVDTRCRVDGKDYEYAHFIVAHQGYMYQLIAWGLPKDGAHVRATTEAMIQRLKPTSSAASPTADANAPGYRSPFGYTVAINAAGWKEWKGREREMPETEHGLINGTRTYFVTVPVLLGGHGEIDSSALIEGLLRRHVLSIENISNLQPVAAESAGKDVTGSTFECTDVDETDHLTRYYRFKLLRNKSVAVLAAAWTLDATQRDKLPAALARFTLDRPAEIDVNKLTKDERHRHCLVFNSAGLYHHNRRQYEAAEPLFTTSLDHEHDAVVLSNLVENHIALKKFTDGHAAAADGMKKYPQRERFLSQAAYCLGELGKTDAAISLYTHLFRPASTYVEDDAIIHYQQMLEKAKRVEGAIAAGETYLARTNDTENESRRVLIEHAELLARNEKAPLAIGLLEQRLRRDPADSRIACLLAGHYIDADRCTDAIATLKPMRDAPDPSFEVLLLHGEAEAGLKQYRQAKASLEAALAKQPANVRARNMLSLVSAQLGEGNNSSVKAPIEPVEFPKSLLAPPANAKVPQDSSGYVIANVRAISFVPGKEFKTTDHRIIKLLDAHAAENYSTMEFTFDALSERLYVNKLEVRDEQGKLVSSAKVDDSYVMDSPDNDSANYEKVLNVPVGGARAGCTVELTITRQDLSRPTTMPWTSHLMQRGLPVQRSVLFMRGDLTGVKHVARNGVSIKEGDGGLCWQMDDLAALRYETMQQPMSAFAPQVHLGGKSATWESEGREYLKQVAERLKPDPAAVELATRLTAGKSSEEEKIAALLRHVQKDYIYRAIEFGRRARVPPPVSETIRNHYGDCKDHSFLLHQLMSACGIESRLALVSTSGPLEKELPSLDQFDHIIVAVPPRADASTGASPPVGTWRFYDCTDKECDLRTGLTHSLVGFEALVLDPQSPRLIDIPLPGGSMGTLDLQRDIKLTAEGDASITETITSTGIEAGSLRSYFQNMEPSKRSESVRKLFEASGTKITLSESSLAGVDDPTQPLVIKASYTVRRRFGATRGQLVGAMPSLWERYWLEPEHVEKRKSPFAIKLPRELRSSVTLRLPSGYRAGDLPEDATIADPFQQAEVKLSAAGDATTLKMEISRTLKAGEHNADAYAKYVQSIEHFLSAVEPYLVLEKLVGASAATK